MYRSKQKKRDWWHVTVTLGHCHDTNGAMTYKSFDCTSIVWETKMQESEDGNSAIYVTCTLPTPTQPKVTRCSIEIHDSIFHTPTWLRPNFYEHLGMRLSKYFDDSSTKASLNPPAKHCKLNSEDHASTFRPAPRLIKPLKHPVCLW